MKKYIWIAIFILFLFITTIEVWGGTYTQNGITITTTETKRNKYIDAAIQTNHDPGTSTATYNDASESAATSGAIKVAEYNDEITIQVSLDTLGSTGIDVLVQGVFGTDTSSWGKIYTKSFSATTAANEDYVLSIQEGALKWIRVGTQATGTDSTDDITVSLRAKGKRP